MTHGDFHMGNVAFTSHNSAVTFFDLQVSRQNSGVTDLVQYLVQVGGTLRSAGCGTWFCRLPPPARGRQRCQSS